MWTPDHTSSRQRRLITKGVSVGRPIALAAPCSVHAKGGAFLAGREDNGTRLDVHGGPGGPPLGLRDRRTVHRRPRERGDGADFARHAFAAKQDAPGARSRTRRAGFTARPSSGGLISAGYESAGRLVPHASAPAWTSSPGAARMQARRQRWSAPRCKIEPCVLFRRKPSSPSCPC